MPQRNVKKVYLPNSFYHIYNRGVEKRVIFNSQMDLNVFEKYLTDSLLKNNIKIYEKAFMPNHYHLLVFQKEAHAIEKMMHSLGTRYTIYFNIRHNRTGHLFQGTYRARLVNTDGDFQAVTMYIRNHYVEDEEAKPGLALW